MKRRTFLNTLGGLVAGAFVSNVAAIYSPGRPWSVAVPKPARPWFHKLRVPILPEPPVLWVGPDEPVPVPRFSFIDFGVGDKDWANYKATGELPRCVVRRLDELRATGRPGSPTATLLPPPSPASSPQSRTGIASIGTCA